MVVLGVMIVGLTLAPYGFADDVAQPPRATHMKVSGVVSKVQSGLTNRQDTMRSDDYCVFSDA
jgi:hypothetical protein